ncbi:aldose 1-epimerase [Nannocystis radixulma]|uniref:Aldose 1-epimerase n=1 Tax=Nannocystis radixulma TaxID=2995305 RepID=A0ABT5BP33_9BACT|nr:aldose 1-epimerase [Nannocystis radixulma]MDC0675920.1 aldose 1-epimerase [Nannocystis radixulma]
MTCEPALPAIGGAPVVRLQCEDRDRAGPAFTSADVAPGRGMLLLQLRAVLPGRGEVELLATPPLDEVARRLDGGPDDFAGNRSFSLGGAILLPFANRIRGRPLTDRREIETRVLGHIVRLPRNWGGRAAGAEQYAMHGLILDRATDELEQTRDRVRGRLRVGDFGGHWLSRTEVRCDYALRPGALDLTVAASNVGPELLPIGIGWHPYFRCISGDRKQAKLYIPASGRVVVNNYDEVLPTGEVQPVSGTSYDFSQPGGRALGELYLDDCFVDLAPRDGRAVAEWIDPAAGLGLRVSAAAPPVSAFQAYAPIDQAFVALEPQYNRADPFGAEWNGADTGMVVLRPGETTTYAVRVELFQV